MAQSTHLDPAALVRRNHRRDLVFGIGGVLSLVIALGLLLALIGDLLVDGAGRISWDFLTSFPSRRAARAGILSAWVGTSLVMLVTALLAVPVGDPRFNEYRTLEDVHEYRLKEIETLAEVPIIALTANVMKGDREKAKHYFKLAQKKAEYSFVENEATEYLNKL